MTENNASTVSIFERLANAIGVTPTDLLIEVENHFVKEYPNEVAATLLDIEREALLNLDDKQVLHKAAILIQTLEGRLILAEQHRDEALAERDNLRLAKREYIPAPEDEAAESATVAELRALAESLGKSIETYKETIAERNASIERLTETCKDFRKLAEDTQDTLKASRKVSTDKDDTIRGLQERLDHALGQRDDAMAHAKELATKLDALDRANTGPAVEVPGEPGVQARLRTPYENALREDASRLKLELSRAHADLQHLKSTNLALAAECSRLGGTPTNFAIGPHKVTGEARDFMLEAAMFHGFKGIDEAGERYEANSDQVVKLMLECRAQGHRDIELGTRDIPDHVAEATLAEVKSENDAIRRENEKLARLYSSARKCLTELPPVVLVSSLLSVEEQRQKLADDVADTAFLY